MLQGLGGHPARWAGHSRTAPPLLLGAPRVDRNPRAAPPPHTVPKGNQRLCPLGELIPPALCSRTVLRGCRRQRLQPEPWEHRTPQRCRPGRARPPRTPPVPGSAQLRWDAGLEAALRPPVPAPLDGGNARRQTLRNPGPCPTAPRGACLHRVSPVQAAAGASLTAAPGEGKGSGGARPRSWKRRVPALPARRSPWRLGGAALGGGNGGASRSAPLRSPSFRGRPRPFHFRRCLGVNFRVSAAPPCPPAAVQPIRARLAGHRQVWSAARIRGGRDGRKEPLPAAGRGGQCEALPTSARGWGKLRPEEARPIR